MYIFILSHKPQQKYKKKTGNIHKYRHNMHNWTGVQAGMHILRGWKRYSHRAHVHIFAIEFVVLSGILLQNSITVIVPVFRSDNKLLFQRSKYQPFVIPICISFEVECSLFSKKRCYNKNRPTNINTDMTSERWNLLPTANATVQKT